MATPNNDSRAPTLSPSLPALTLTPPWGSLIAVGAIAPALGKHIETRSWATRYRGPLAIHQARGLSGMSLADYAALCEQPFFREALAALGYMDPDAIPRGAIVAVADLVAIHPTETISAAISERERTFGDYAPGRFAWELQHIRRVEPPIPARGALGLWLERGRPHAARLSVSGDVISFGEERATFRYERRPLLRR